MIVKIYHDSKKPKEKIINVVVVKVRIFVKMVITAAVHYNIIVEIGTV